METRHVPPFPAEEWERVWLASEQTRQRPLTGRNVNPPCVGVVKNNTWISNFFVARIFLDGPSEKKHGFRRNDNTIFEVTPQDVVELGPARLALPNPAGHVDGPHPTFSTATSITLCDDGSGSDFGGSKVLIVMLKL